MTSRFTIPNWVKEHTFEYDDYTQLPEDFFQSLRDRLARFREENPVVSIVIPAYNEEQNILRTLSSLSRLRITYPTEILVVNNNSKDRTQEILDRCGVRSAFQPLQGISLTRQMGLEKARGKYILNADADSIYPSGWATEYVSRLQNPEVCCVYGRYSFIPSSGSGRFLLGLYECLAETLFSIRRRNRDYLNVMGFNFAFRKADGLQVGGFNTRRPRWSDGWMAMTLMQLGSIELVRTDDARVWTSDRRLMHDGGLGKAFILRIRKEIRRLAEYLLPGKAVKQSHPKL